MKLHHDEHRWYTLVLRITQEEREAIEDAAREDCLRPGPWARAVLMRHVRALEREAIAREQGKTS